MRRLEALRRGGIVERLEEGVWRVPSDLPAQGAKYDVRKRGRLVVEVRSHLSLEQSVRALGATWLRGQCARLFPYDDPDDWVEEVAGLLAGVREFYRRAAASGRSVLFTSDELLDRIYPPGGQA